MAVVPQPTSSGKEEMLARSKPLPMPRLQRETVADQIARGPGILSRADSLVVSSAHGETQSSEIPTFIARSSCSGTVCHFSERRTGLSLTLRLSDLEFAPGNSQSVSTKHDITLIRSVGSFQDINFRALGTWMQHSGFTVQMERFHNPRHTGGCSVRHGRRRPDRLTASPQRNMARVDGWYTSNRSRAWR